MKRRGLVKWFGAAVLVVAWGCGGGDGGSGAPDLQVSSVSFSPSSVEVGSDITVSTIAENAGTSDAAATDITVYLSTDTTLDAGDFELGTRPVGALAAGETEPAAVDSVFTVPSSVDAGFYFVLAEIDRSDSVSESDESNNVTASGATVAITKRPDLTVDNVSLGVTTVAVNEQVSVSRRLRNIGLGSAGAFTVKYYLSSDTTLDAGDYLAGTENVAGLGENTDASGSYVISVGSSTGTFYVLVEIDAGDAVVETDETNNTAQALQQLTVVAAGQPDLVPTVETAPDSMYVGETISVTVNVRNQGSATASPASTWTITIYLSDDQIVDGSDDELGYVNTNANVAPGGEFVHTFSNVTVPNHTTANYIIARADTHNDIAESDEANNYANKAVTVLSPPDLTLSAGPAMGYDLPPVVRQGGSTTDIFAHIQELNGVNVTTTMRVSAYLSSDTTIDQGDFQIAYEDVASFPGGASGSQRLSNGLTVTLDPGVYNLGCIVDSLDQVFESDETNNVNTGAQLLDMEVLPPNLGSSEYDLIAYDCWSDLKWVDLGGGYTMRTLVPGSNFQCNVRVSSLGGDPGGTFRVAVYLSPDATVDQSDDMVGYKDITAADLRQMFSNGRVTVDCQAPAVLTPGETYYYGAMVDSEDAVAEIDETNNMSSTDAFVAVASSAAEIDLIADGLDGPIPMALQVNREFSIAPSVEVDANTDTGSFVINVYLSVDNDLSTTGDNTLVGTATIPAPGYPAGYHSEGADPDMWIRITPTTAGSFYLGYVVDDGGDVSETDETNNTWISEDPVTVATTGGSDLVTLCYVPPEGEPGSAPAPTFYAQTGDTVTLPLLIAANFGTEDVPAGTVINVYLSSSDTIPPTRTNDTLVGTYTCGALPAGEYEFYDHPITLDLSGLAAGTYYLYAYIDPDDNVSELNENNNDSASFDIGLGQAGFVPVVISDAAPAKPNLIVHNIDTDDTYSLGAPTYVWLGCEVFNTSLSAQAGPSVVSFWISQDTNSSIGSSDVYLGSMPVGFVEPGYNFRADLGSVPLPFTPTVGADYYIKARVDVLSEVDETEETDNLSVSNAFQFTN